MKYPFIIALLMLFYTASSLPAAETKPATLTAQEVVNHMLDVYTNAKSYSDSGTATYKLPIPLFPKHEISFSTAFVRPDKFRFEYTELSSPGSKSHYIVWRSGADIQSWWNLKGLEKETSIGMALAGPTGISMGTAHTIPALLMYKEVGGRSLQHLAEPKLLEGNAEEGSDCCYLVEGKYAGSSVVLWIDKQSFLIRRIKDDSPNQTTIYNPTVNGEIAEEKLEFKAPVKQ